MWNTLVRRYWQVALCKETPANTPYSPFLLAVVTALFFLLILTQWYVATPQENLAVLPSIFTAFTILLTYYLYTFVLLKINKTINRYVQTLTALIAVHLMIHLISFPLLLLVPFFTRGNVYPNLLLILGIVYLVCTLALMVWQFLATAFIYRYALDLEFLPSLLVSVGLFIFNILVVSL